MSIKYFPNRVFKNDVPAIDRVLAKRQVKLIRGRANVASTAMNVVVSANSGWHLNSIKLTFSSTTSRDYSVKILGGVKILQNLNDYLWFQTSNSLWQKITLSPGFYTGTQLATELQTKLNANAAFVALGRTFTVSYDADNGVFDVGVDTGTLRYIQTNNTQQMSERDSIAGHLFGLTVDTEFASNVVSNSNVYGLNQESWIINETGSIATEDFTDDIRILDIDQALHLSSNTASLSIDYEIGFEEVV